MAAFEACLLEASFGHGLQNDVLGESLGFHGTVFPGLHLQYF